VFKSHRHPVSCISLSHDGECLLSGSLDESVVKFWSVSEVSVLHELDRHTSGVTCVAFSKDDKFAVSGSRGGGVVVWPIKPAMGTETVLEGHHSNAITAVIMIYDNEVVISGSEDKSILVWEMKSGTVIRSLLMGHTKGITCLGFVQTPSQHLLLSGSKDKTIILWDIMEGTSEKTYESHSRSVNCIAVSNDYQLFASAGKDPLIKLHSLMSEGSEVHASFEGHNGPIYSLAFSYDDKVLLSAGEDERVIMWNIETRDIVRDIASGGGIVSSLACHYFDSSVIFFGCQDCSIKSLDISKENAMEIFDKCHYKVTSVLLSACKKKMLTGSDDSLIRVWDVASRALLHTLKGHHKCITALAMSSDNKLIVSGSKDKTIRLWTVKKGRFVSRVLEGHRGAVSCLTLTEDKHDIFSGSSSPLGGTALLAWEVQTGEMTIPMREGHPQGITCVASAAEFNMLITGSQDGTLRVMELSRTINDKHVMVIQAHTHKITSVAIARGTRRVVSGSMDGLVKLWDGHTAEFHRLFEHAAGVTCLAICSNSSYDIVTGCMDGSVSLWHGTTGEIIRSMDKFFGPIESIAFSEDGDAVIYSSNAQTLKYWLRTTTQKVRFTKGRKSREILAPDGKIIPGSDDTTVKVFHKNTPQKSYALEGHTDAVLAVDISVDNSKVLSGGRDAKVILWDRKKAAIIRSMPGHRDSVNCVAISSSNNFLVSGSSDHKVIIWNATTGYLLFHLEGHTAAVTSLAISKDCSTIVTGSDDKSVALWSVQTGTQMLVLDEPPTIPVEYAMEDLRGTPKKMRKAVTKWNSGTNRRVSVLDVSHGIILSVCMASDNSFVLAGSDNNLIIKWDIMGKITLVFPGHSGAVNCVTISAEHHLMVSGSDDKTIRIWNTANAKCYNVLRGHKGNVAAVSLTADNRTVISASYDPVEAFMIIWSAEDGKMLRMFEQPGGIADMRISSDGDMIVSAGLNRTIRIDEKVLTQPHLLYALEVYNRSGGLDHLKDLFTMFPGLLYEHWQNKNILLSLLEIDNVEFFSEVVTIAPLSIFATLISQDGTPKNILGCAIEMNADKCIRVMLEVYTELLTEDQEDLDLDHDYIPDDSKYIPYNPTKSRYPYYPLVEINYLIQIASITKFRIMFVEFIRRLKCVKTEDAILLGCAKRALISGDGQLIVGSDSLHCDRFWEDYIVNDDSAPAIEAFVVPLKNIASLNSNFLKDIVDVAEKERRFDIFTSEIIEILLTFKWNTFIKPMFVRDLRIHYLYAVIYCANVIHMSKYSDAPHPATIALYVLLIALFAYICKLNVVQMVGTVHGIQDLRKYFSNIRNICSYLSLLGAFFTILFQLGLYVKQDSDSSTLLSAHNGCAAITCPLLIIDILFFLKNLRRKGALIRMIFKMIECTKVFFGVLCMVVLAFAASFTVIFKDSQNYSTYLRSVMSVFGFLVGNFSIEEINDSSLPLIGNILLLTFLLFVSITVLNLMIAMVGDKYDEVTNTSKADATYSMARLILRYERVISMSDKLKHEHEWYPVWLQVARNSNSGNSFNDGGYKWAGRIQRLEECMAYNTSMMKTHTKRLVEPSSAIINHLKSNIDHLQKEQQQLKEDVKQIILLLEQQAKKDEEEKDPFVDFMM
jgi:WD40 repeat protein